MRGLWHGDAERAAQGARWPPKPRPAEPAAY